MDLLREIRDFLGGLRKELPEVFASRPAVPAGRETFLNRVEHFAPRMGVRPARVRVKDLRSLWGSCSARGSLNFNWRLLLAPPEVLDYVVVHELAHLAETSHSRRFWALVSEYCPEHRERRRWLKENGGSLLRRRVRRELLDYRGVEPACG